MKIQNMTWTEKSCKVFFIVGAISASSTWRSFKSRPTSGKYSVTTPLKQQTRVETAGQMTKKPTRYSGDKSN